MAAVAIMRTYFRDVINFSEETARTIIDQGLYDFDSLVEFTKAYMKILCTTICRTGGMINNPRVNIADQPPTICDPGHLISMVAEKRLLMTAYAAMHQSRTSRQIYSQSMTQTFSMYLDLLQEQDLAYSKPRAIYKPLRDTSMSKWLESLDDYLLKCRGANKCPLAYVARYQVAVKPHAMDPAADYENIDKEMTSRSPHDQFVYGADNKTLWNILHDALKYHP